MFVFFQGILRETGLALVTQQSLAFVTLQSEMQAVAGKTGHREMKEHAMFMMSKRLLK
jgi:hypothetical protein